MTRDEHYWVGSLSTTIAIAATDPEPQPILRSAIKEFLRGRPAGNELGDRLRAILKEKP
jgi:hypothetical protein